MLVQLPAHQDRSWKGWTLNSRPKYSARLFVLYITTQEQRCNLTFTSSSFGPPSTQMNTQLSTETYTFTATNIEKGFPHWSIKATNVFLGFCRFSQNTQRAPHFLGSQKELASTALLHACCTHLTVFTFHQFLYDFTKKLIALWVPTFVQLIVC